MIADKCFKNGWVAGVGWDIPQASAVTVENCVPSHPLRAGLQKLHTLDPIRIIEGKA